MYIRVGDSDTWSLEEQCLPFRPLFRAVSTMAHSPQEKKLQLTVTLTLPPEGNSELSPLRYFVFGNVVCIAVLAGA